MAYTCPRDLDSFIPHLSKQDTKFKQQLGLDLLAFLADPSNSIVCQDIGTLVDGLIPWMQSSNYKVSCNGIEVMTSLIDRLGHDFKPYLQSVLPAVIDRLGDAKDTVREKAQLLILKLLERSVLSPSTLFEKLTPGFAHKNAKIREEVLRCLVNTLNEHGAQSVVLSRYIPHIVKLLSDSTATVRDTAFSTLVDLYKHVGDKLKFDIQKRNLVPQARLPALLARFDEVKNAGELLPTASIGIDISDEVDRVAMPKPAVPVKKAGLGSAVKRSASSTSRTTSSNSANAAGALDEETFLKSFEDVPVVQLFSPKDITEHMKAVTDIISDPSKDWSKRTDALKKIRSLIIAGATSHEDFHSNLKQLEIPLQASIKDLRSQVVRETCITIAYLSQTLGNKFDRASEGFLNPLINLIQNSAKIIATSGLVCVRIIIQHTQSSRLVPIIISNLINHKSKDIRRSCCEFLEQLLNQWQTYTLEKHVGILQDGLKKGIADADPDARIASRKAFKTFRDYFPEQAENLLQSLDPTYRRALQGELCLSNSSSSGSLAQSGGMKTLQRYKMVSTPQSTPESAKKPGFRSNSAIDLQAAQRAKARAQYAAIGRHKLMSGTSSLPRPKKPPEASPTEPRMGRTRSRNSGVSHSQPTSRSGSPSSRVGYLGYRGNMDHESSPRPRRLSSGIPRSTTGSRDTSRETSPTRGTSLSRLKSRGSDRPPISPASRPVMAQRMLQQSREAECALADALQNDSSDFHRLSSPRKAMRSLDNHSDDSETSSVCSERSLDSFRRPSDSYSWSGSQQRLSSSNIWEPSRDINEIIALCASTVWQERKDGLVSLRYYLNNGSSLSTGELLHITEIFTKMFMDSHTKGLSVFLDTLNELIKCHKAELNDWLYVLLQRVFYKLGTDLLNSTHSKLLNTLDIIKKNFNVQLQLCCIYRFLCDTTQTPNTKVKVSVLNYLTSLCSVPEVTDCIDVSPANQALMKIINYTQDVKSIDIRNAAKICIVALWNCNTPVITQMFSELSKPQHEIVRNIVHNHMRKSSTDGSEPSSPGSKQNNTGKIEDNLSNQEEIYRSLRKTTAEIQNYSYETLGTKLDRDTISQDSGISQMSTGNDAKGDIGVIEEHMEALTIKPNFKSKPAGPHSLPYSINGMGDCDNGYTNPSEMKEEELILKILEQCTVDHPTSKADKLKLLSQLKYVIKQGQIEHVELNFKKLLRILIDNLNQDDSNIQVSVLQILTEIFKNNKLTPCWSSFVELLTLRVLNVHNESTREVVKAAESTAAAMSVFPFSTVINVLSPFIQTSSFPTVQGAIKMLTKLVETHPDDVSDEHLSNVLPGLIKANDHEESAVRKSAVFCMVALHKAVGEDRLAPHIKVLTGSKLKLLRLYISRAEQVSSVPTSPKTSSNS